MSLPNPARVPNGARETVLAPLVDQPIITQAVNEIAANAGRYEHYRRYYEGAHTLNFATDKFKNAFGNLFRAFAENICGVVVDSVTDRLLVTGFTVTEGADSAQAVAEADAIWEANRMDAVSTAVHEEAARAGDAYVIVWPDEAGEPNIQYNDAAMVAVRYDSETRRKLVWAAKAWVDEMSGKLRLTLYFPDRIEKYISRKRLSSTATLPSDPKQYEPFRVTNAQGQREAWPLPNPYGRVPVFPFHNGITPGRLGHSELRDVIPLQNAVNKTRADSFVASEFVAFPQRTATGISVPKDPATGEDVDPFTPGVDRLWYTANENAKFGQFPSADLKPYLDQIISLYVSIAVVSGTPIHHLVQVDGGWPSGEALSLDTPVQTPSGVVPIGAITPGTQVFDERGQIQIVEHVFAVMHDRPCYRIEFDDGSMIVADANHRWYTETYTERKRGRPGSVKTTLDLANSVYATNEAGELLRAGRKHTPITNHRIPVAASLNLPVRDDLPVEPYALGVWLGDGCSHSGIITQHVEDAPQLVTALAGAGVNAAIRDVGRDTTVVLVLDRVNESGYCRRGHRKPQAVGKCPECEHLSYRHRYYGEPLPPQTNLSMFSRLKQAGLIQNKHIPEAYFTASHDQRLALLQGLMDTDGTVTPSGSVVLELHNERLARDAHRLIQSLGHKCALRTASDWNGSTRYRMAWSAPEMVFQMPRKREKQRCVTTGKARYRYIRSVTPVDSVPVRCIAVSGKSKLFLIGDAFIPTHNSLKTAESRYVAKIKRKQAVFGNVWEDVIAFCRQIKDLPAVTLSTEWASAEPRSDAELLESLEAKQRIGIPTEQLWDEAGYTTEQIARMKAQRAAQTTQTGPALGNETTVLVDGSGNQIAEGEAS